VRKRTPKAGDGPQPGHARYDMKSFAIIPVRAQTSPRAWRPFALPGPPRLKNRETSLVSGSRRAGGTHYGSTAMHVQDPARFAEPNLRIFSAPGKILPAGEKGQPFIDAAQRSIATLPHPAARRGGNRTTRALRLASLLRRCKPPSGGPPRQSPSPVTPRGPHRKGIRSSLAAGTSPV